MMTVIPRVTYSVPSRLNNNKAIGVSIRRCMIRD